MAGCAQIDAGVADVRDRPRHAFERRRAQAGRAQRQNRRRRRGPQGGRGQRAERGDELGRGPRERRGRLVRRPRRISACGSTKHVLPERDTPTSTPARFLSPAAPHHVTAIAQLRRGVCLRKVLYQVAGGGDGLTAFARRASAEATALRRALSAGNASATGGPRAGRSRCLRRSKAPGELRDARVALRQSRAPRAAAPSSADHACPHLASLSSASTADETVCRPANQRDHPQPKIQRLEPVQDRCPAEGDFHPSSAKLRALPSTRCYTLTPEAAVWPRAPGCVFAHARTERR